ncbi:potassium channel family protein [Nitratidesulfovibrio sp. SRB-5]|uniref:potassium channel family protein n=1 Tax=Nitratidesulfovibrio sp. SRB-5 TaxID=2872636 RepID=UPI0010270F0D|nr:NAD-binding protein [Nitratidesulfovibrio sp. SRB-5]MBZ2172650.1 NAD-binding protein [Nitratidesulfovibrio sp. SRB-5]RXF76523.1 potassium channel protein [Desulfovibrio sp. DS-1]
MKFLPSQIAFFMQSRSAQRNMRFLFRFVLLLVAVITLYSVLFHVIMDYEGRDYSWATGFYWTLTVMSTLGFGDITFLSDTGKLFTLVVLLSGIIFLLVMLPFTFIQFFYAPWLEAQTRLRAPRELPAETRDHVIIVGGDATALGLGRDLAQYAHPYVLLCADAQTALDLQDQGFSVAVGDYDDPETYRRLRVEQAAMLVALDGDVRNTNVAFTAREASPGIPVVCGADQDEAVDILTMAGGTHVFRFSNMLGQGLARRTLAGNMRTGVVGRFDDLVVAEAPVMRTGLVGHSLRDSDLRKVTGVNVVGVWERGRFQLPRPGAPLEASTVLVLAGTRQQMDAFDRYIGGRGVNGTPGGVGGAGPAGPTGETGPAGPAGKTGEAGRHGRAGGTSTAPASDAPVLILGGGRVGLAAARQFAETGIDYRIVEKNPRLVHDDTHTITGSAADLDVLERAGIREAPAVLVTTHDDDLNIYLTIYCRRLRPDIQIITRATLDRNIGILHKAGADLVMSHGSLVSNTVINLLNPGKVLMLSEGLNIFRAPVGLGLAGRTLKDSGIRDETGCSVVALRGPGGLSVNPDPALLLRSCDELILIGDSEAERRFLERYPDNEECEEA